MAARLWVVTRPFWDRSRLFFSRSIGREDERARRRSWAAAMRELSGQTEPSELLDSSSADGRERRTMAGGGKEEEQRRLREIKGALIKGLSLLSFDRGKEVEKEG